MNPLFQQFIYAVLRWLLMGVGTWFVQKGILEQGQVDAMVGGAILAIIALGWSLWNKYTSKRESNTRAAMPKGATLDQANASIARGISAPAGTGAGDVPVLVNTNAGDSVKPPAAAWLLPLLLTASLAGGVLVSGCATVQTNPPVDSIQAVRNQAAVLAKATKEAATLAVQARRLAQTAYDNKAITAAQMQKINQASIFTSSAGLAFIDFAETVTTDPSLRVTAAELLKVFDGFIASLTEAGQSGAAIRTALTAFVAYLGVQP